MPTVGKKRQITLPVDQCVIAGIRPGDECDCYVDDDGHLIIRKKTNVVENNPPERKLLKRKRPVNKT